MSIKISANMSAVAHHVIDGPFTFPYAIDAHSAISRFPKEWSEKPWSAAAAAEARKATGAPDIELTPEEQAAVDDHAKAVEAANERLKAFHEKKAAEKAETDQVARDEAIVNSAPPRPDTKIKVKPLSNAQIRQRAAETDDERMVREKADEDKLAAASAGGAPITG